MGEFDYFNCSKSQFKNYVSDGTHCTLNNRKPTQAHGNLITFKKFYATRAQRFNKTVTNITKCSMTHRTLNRKI